MAFSTMVLVAFQFNTLTSARMVVSKYSRNRRLKDNLNKDIKAVVCDFDGSANTDWIESDMDIERVGRGSPPLVGESRPWLQWIVDNYDALPPRVFFSHGHEDSWHCDHAIRKIEALRGPVTVLSPCTWPRNDLYVRSVWDGELPALDGIHLALFNATWSAWLAQHNGFVDRHCCAENVATSDAIRRFDREVYQELIATIDAITGIDWGHVFERTWQSIFEEGPKVPTEDIVKRLQDLRRYGQEIQALFRGSRNLTFLELGAWAHANSSRTVACSTRGLVDSGFGF
mmetsp:Transcript_114998/g.245601  ORF Transcript_114998/g.245601 Transcript_114998/m.245601 type:complete len:286 (-) Transcript_114998:207-1064(-)